LLDDQLWGQDLTAFRAAVVGVQTDLLERVWPQGRNPGAPWDGDHFVLRGHQRPVSVSRTEALFLANVVALRRPSLVLEIGTGFGYSALWIAAGLALSSGPGTVVSIDNWSEAGTPAGRAAGLEMVTRAGLADRVHFVTGTSPEDVPGAARGRHVDIAFIDANHHGDQPRLDYQAVNAETSLDAMLLFHDVDRTRYTVPEAVAAAVADGWHDIALVTSCHMHVLVRSDAAGNDARAAYGLAVARQLWTTGGPAAWS
jgi:predicted O-methyltransferase YrrM